MKQWTESRMRLLFQWCLKIAGWKISGTAPQLKKFIIIVAPHTSNYDFFLGIAVRGAVGFRANYLGKEVLFKRPWGWIFRKLGGFPVKRDKSYNQVDHVVKLIRQEENFVLALAPEGTRSKIKKWRTGFYWMARLGEVPIIMISFDYGSRTVTFSEPFYVTGDIETDFIAIKSFFTGVTGFNLEDCGY